MGGVTVLKNVLALIATMTGLLMSPAAASDTVLLHAAGSLRGALAEVSQAFEKSVPFKVQAKFGASGLLKDGSPAAPGPRCLHRRTWNIRGRWRPRKRAGRSCCSRATNCARWFVPASP